MLGELSNDQMLSVLQMQTVGRIGCYANGKLYVVPVTYAFDSGYLYAHSKEGLKINMMRSNPHVCFEVDTIENMANWRSVIIWGQFEELKDEDSRQNGLKILTDKILPLVTSETVRAHDHSLEPHQVTKGLRAVVFRIKINEMTGRFEKS
jgi:uncharacterized protein